MLTNVGTAVVRRTTGLARRTVVSRTSPALAGVDKPDIDFVSVDGMERKYSKTPYHLRKAIRVKATGKSLLSSPAFNKGASFSLGERDRLQLRGLLPPRKVTMKQQVERTEQQLAQEDSMIRKNRYMRDLLDTNETLFHRVLLDNIKELAPVIYTPTVGQACLEFGESFRRPRGMYFNHNDVGDMGAMMYHWPSKDVHVAVVTDGSRILGLGDLGTNGMGIPIGKLALYCAAGGIAPHRVLPVMFDVGTNNEELLESESYLGLQHRRIDGDQYYEMMDEFVQALFHRFPNVFLQFEDFSSDKALTILDRYRDRYLCFNDDVQGTGAISVAGLMGALKLQGKSASDLKDQRIIIAGAGSAGIGVATALSDAMVLQGLTKEEACARFWVCDVNGVLDAAADLDPQQQPFGRSDDTVGMNLEQCADAVKPTVLLGLSAVGGLFSETLVRTMAGSAEHPIIFPLSNPTANAECSNHQALEWTNGKAIFASGSPFEPVDMFGKSFVPSQCNNMYIFPGLGLGACLSKAKRVSDGMIYASSLAVADSVSEEERRQGMVFPDIERIREVSHRVACYVIRAAVEEGLDRATFARTMGEDELSEYVSSKMYDPVYVPLAQRRESF
jgi:malate dehydrogenase (oxaloacetate-decarboxylating)(NADP+)